MESSGMIRKKGNKKAMDLEILSPPCIDGSELVHSGHFIKW